MSDSNTLKITISENLRVKLKVMAEESGQSESVYIRKVLTRHMQDQQDLCTAERRLNELEQGESITYTLDQAMSITKAIHNGGDHC